MSTLPPEILYASRFWAIQQTDSEFRKWNNSKDLGSIAFDWQEIGIAGNSNLHDIIIAVDRKRPDEDPERVKAIAHGIYYFSRLRTGDIILRVNGENVVTGIGMVESKKTDFSLYYYVDVFIEWLMMDTEPILSYTIFNPKLEIQKIKRNDFGFKSDNVGLSPYEKELIRKFDEESSRNRLDFDDRSFELKHFHRLLDELRFRSESLSRDDIHLNISKLNETLQSFTSLIPLKEGHSGMIPLFYGTNRNDTGNNDANVRFGDEESVLSYGTCEVSIPPNHLPGEMNRPTNFIIYERHEDDKKDIVLKKIDKLSEVDFFKTIQENFGRMDEKEALIFIHGYNNSFASAARRAAQIACDLPFKGISGFYSWPSSASWADYLGDEARARASRPFFQEFIEGFITKTGIDKLHLIAHSMGNLLMATTIENLSDKEALAQYLDKIHQIILAAPDIDEREFKTNILPKFGGVGKRRTIYSSDRDLALGLSEGARGGRRRLGDAGASLFLDKALDTIDASDVKASGILKHGYIFEAKEILTDLFYLLHEELPPVQRRLRGVPRNPFTYWLFP